MPTATTLRLTGLGKRQMSKLATRAKRMGLSPSGYIKQLIDDDLETDRLARTTTFAEIVGPGKEVDETELDQLVDRARTRHHQRISKCRY